MIQRDAYEVARAVDTQFWSVRQCVSISFAHSNIRTHTHTYTYTHTHTPTVGNVYNHSSKLEFPAEA